MSKQYRRRVFRDTRHFREDCSNWPGLLYKTSPKRPTTGELCDECRAKARNAHERKAPRG